ncbi:alpha/beta-Hydrolases superfamily protein [Abeliophyllum distichum]|uniref:Alpha/beta-Hydrolases superfamily protein n=1 Tax=Abeliophyllum distichum TaxID=126358 RepID=A0ABD1NSA8_9LAMI
MEHKHPIAEANETSPFGSLTPEQFYARHSVSHASEYITSKQGLKLFTQWWTPNQIPIKGILCVVHGYTGESSWFVQLTSVHIAKHGFAVCAMDHMGHGFSEGLAAHLPDMNLVVDECILFFNKFRAGYALNLPAFLYAESLGGAIALLITLRRDGVVPVKPFDGVVLNGAMCGISDKFKPPWPLEHFLSIAAALVPTWCIVPTRGSIPLVSFKVEWKRKLALASPRRTLQRPRAATAQELLRLYERAASNDKTLRIYPGMWHQLIGEPDENVELVFSEVVKWLVTRADQAAAGPVVKDGDVADADGTEIK